jgi:hypothetical protein
MSSNLNETEREHMSKYYADMEIQRRKNKEKVFGGFWPKK